MDKALLDKLIESCKKRLDYYNDKVESYTQCSKRS